MKINKNKTYLKVRTSLDCLECGQKTLEIVVKGQLNSKRKEQPSTEKIIGYCCQNCNFKTKININKKNV